MVSFASQLKRNMPFHDAIWSRFQSAFGATGAYFSESDILRGHQSRHVLEGSINVAIDVMKLQLLP